MTRTPPGARRRIKGSVSPPRVPSNDHVSWLAPPDSRVSFSTRRPSARSREARKSGSIPTLPLRRVGKCEAFFGEGYGAGGLPLPEKILATLDFFDPPSRGGLNFLFIQLTRCATGAQLHPVRRDKATRAAPRRAPI